MYVNQMKNSLLWWKLCITTLTCLYLITIEANQEPLLIYSTNKEIRVVYNIKNGKNSHKSVTLIRNLSEGAALDFHYADKKLCWADHVLESISCAFYDGVEAKNKVEIMNSNDIMLSPEGLACDWFTNKLYWIDLETNRIEVGSMQTYQRKVLYWTDIDQPRAIALVPKKGLMFWSDWGDEPKIERAGMNGDASTRKVIVSEKIFWPNSIAVDHEQELLYWIDGKLLFLDVMDFNGEKRKTILSNYLRYPFAVALYRNEIYISDWLDWGIFKYSLNETGSLKQVVKCEDAPRHLVIWDEERQPHSYNPCEHNNGGCSDLCLLAPYKPGYTCACPIGVKLIDNMTCSDGPQELLIIARRTDICIVYLDSPEYSDKVLPLTNVTYSIAVDYDPVEGFMYWTDDEEHKIQRAKLDGSEQSVVIANEILHPDGVAIDWIARNLYWTDADTDRIEVARLDAKYRKVVIIDNLEKPRAIAVAPELGWMFWSDWSEQDPKIERSNLDGSEREVIVATDLTWPNGVALDTEKMKIYWCDAQKHRIEYANMDGTERSALVKDVPHAFGFSLMGEFLYWTDWQVRTVSKVHKVSGHLNEVIIERIPNMMGLKAVRLGQVNGTNPCAINNGGCSQLCLYRHNKTYICTCQIDYELMEDRKSCRKPQVFFIYSNEDTIGRASIRSVDYKEIIPIRGIRSNISSVDYDPTNQRIYWSDTKTHTIMRAYINGSDPQVVVNLGMVSPVGIAVDWVAHNIYWCDSGGNRIEVARLDGSSRKSFLCQGIDEPHSIVVFPGVGYMYWSEWGHSNYIRRAAMDGSDPVTIVSNTRAICLTMDYEKKRLYWVEVNPYKIAYLDWNTVKKEIFLESPVKITSITILYEYIYWSEQTGSIFRMNKYNKSEKQEIAHLPEGATDLLAIYPLKQEQRNQCAINNGGCSHLCLTQPSQNTSEPQSFTCACPTHYTYHQDNCEPPTDFMIYSQRNLAMRLLPDKFECSEAVLPIQGFKNNKSIDFDPLNSYIYWIEAKSHDIKRALTTGANMSNVVKVHEGENMPFDIVIDPIGRLLFWSDSIKNAINVTRLHNNSIVGAVVKNDQEKPRLLAIHPRKRLLFYTDVRNSSFTQLIRIRLDGSQRITIKKTDTITALAVDTENDMVVWAQENVIFTCNIDGDNEHILLNESNSKVTHLAVYSGWLYWLDRAIQQLHKLELNYGGSRSIELQHVMQIQDLISVHRVNMSHQCFQRQDRRCSHLCVLNGASAECSCPLNLTLQKDNRTCMPEPGCDSKLFTCSSESQNRKDCIPVEWRCDGQKDCPTGLDEEDCPVCKNDQFRCNNKQCIDKSFVCDGTVHCSDDELNCCRSSEFQCPNTNVCIPNTLLCDGMDNCADGDDERVEICGANKLVESSKNVTGTVLTVVFVVISIAVALAVAAYITRKRCAAHESPMHDQSEDPLSPDQPRSQIKVQNKMRKVIGIPDVIHMSMINGSHSSSYDRNHITGASSSTNVSSLMCYPRETLNPPPSPATTGASTRGSSPSSRYRPYRHYRSINQPPPPTPCSTDVCDESDYNYPIRSRYDGGPFPPPPTPRSHCYSESCPPSPSSRSSTYFSPLPPPPSPVPSPTD